MSNKFEELGVHPILIKFFEDQEPFYYLDPDFEGDETPKPKSQYVVSLVGEDCYEGEVDGSVDFNGRGLSIREGLNQIVIR